MTALRVAAALIVTLVWISHADAVDLTKIDRTIAREPEYESKVPTYCLMVFGEEATHRVWLVLDGDHLFVDRNANGDLTEKGERLAVKTPNQDPAQFEPTELLLEGTPHKFMFHLFHWFDYQEGKTEKAEPSLDVWWNEGRRIGAWGDERSPLKFSARPKNAPIVHIGGPLQMGFEIRNPLRKAGGKKFELNAAVGTRGLGPGTFAHLLYNVIPEDVFPQATLEFPNADPGKPAVRVDVPIKQRC